MTFFKVMQYATVGFGFLAVAMSFGLFLHFIRSRKTIGKAVALMLLGEAVGGAVTVGFAIAADGVIDIAGPKAAMGMRWVMFFTAMITSIHLAYQTWKVEVYGCDD